MGIIPHCPIVTAQLMWLWLIIIACVLLWARPLFLREGVSRALWEPVAQQKGQLWVRGVMTFIESGKQRDHQPIRPPSPGVNSTSQTASQNLLLGG